MQRFVDFHKGDFTGVRRIVIGEPNRKPFVAQALDAKGWRIVGEAATAAAAEALARGHRIDKRREGIAAQTRIKERRQEGGYGYIAV